MTLPPAPVPHPHNNQERKRRRAPSPILERRIARLRTPSPAAAADLGSSTALGIQGAYPEGCVVWVRNVHEKSTKTSLKNLFAALLEELQEGSGKGVEFVDYEKGTMAVRSDSLRLPPSSFPTPIRSTDILLPLSRSATSVSPPPPYPSSPTTTSAPSPPCTSPNPSSPPPLPSPPPPSPFPPPTRAARSLRSCWSEIRRGGIGRTCQRRRGRGRGRPRGVELGC